MIGKTLKNWMKLTEGSTRIALAVDYNTRKRKDYQSNTVVDIRKSVIVGCVLTVPATSYGAGTKRQPLQEQGLFCSRRKINRPTKLECLNLLLCVLVSRHIFSPVSKNA